MILGVDPKIDYAFKKVFGSESNIDLLLSLLDAVLRPPPEQRIVSATIENPFNERETLDGKWSILDIKVRDQAGRLYNVEMEMLADRIFPQRVLYYWALLYGEQLNEG